MDSIAMNPPESAIEQAVYKAKDEIKQLREKLLVKRGEGRVDLNSVEEALLRTEETLKYRTEEILGEINNQVRSLPFTAVQAAVNPFDSRKQQQASEDHEEEAQTYHLTTVVPLFTDDPRDLIGENSKSLRKKMLGEAQQDKHGVQLPQIAARSSTKHPPERHGRAVETLSPIPVRQHSRDLELISDSEAHIGGLDRKLPRATQLAFDPPIQFRTVALHDRSEPPTQPAGRITLANDSVPPLEFTPERVDSGVRLDSEKKSKPVVPSDQVKEKKRFLKRNKSDKDFVISSQQIQPFPPPATPATVGAEPRTFRFNVHHGRLKEQSNEYQNFRRSHSSQWGCIVNVLGHLLKLLADYSIPVAQVNGNTLACVSEEVGDSSRPTREHLLNCLLNRADVEQFLRIPGRRYFAADGQVAAVIKLQASWRRYTARNAYLQYKRKKRAVGVICAAWIHYSQINKIRKTLQAKRQKQLENLRARNAQLAEDWKRLKNETHVLVHLPSLGYSKQVRKTTDNLQVHESAQIGRLFDLADSKTDVIYLSSSQTGDEINHYYSKLVALRKAVLTGDQSQIQTMDERFKLLVPETAKQFQSRNLPLSSVLKYSPHTLKRIKNIVRGRSAYIVPGLPTMDDVYVADVLGLPMLSAEPQVAQLYSTKSGAKRILKAAEVVSAPHEYDIYSIQQLHEALAQLITRNILNVKKFLLKMDSEHHSRGIAIIDVSGNLPCYAWAWREADKYGENWNQTWAQEQVLLKVLEQVPIMLEKHAQPLNKEAYPTWSKFCEVFVASGGVIEAAAPSQSPTCFSVECLIEPDGNVNVLCSGDHIHLRDEPYYQAAVSIPQCSVEAAAVNQACLQIAEACKQRKILGYFSVEFVTFVDARSNEQVIWATDLKLRYSEQLANFQLVKFVTNGDFVADSHELSVTNAVPKKPVSTASSSQQTPQASREASNFSSTNLSTVGSTSTNSISSFTRSVPIQHKERKSKATEKDRKVRVNQRYAVVSSRLFHANMNLIQYSVFFQMCRANGIGYDIKEKEGSLFLLRDSTKREYSTMVTVGDKLGDALSLFAKNLNVLNQEAATVNAAPRSNYKAIIDDIDSIMKLLGLNYTDDKNRQKS